MIEMTADKVKITIHNLKQAESFLSQFDQNYPVIVEEFLSDLLAQRKTWTDFIQIEQDIKHRLQQLYHNLTDQREVVEICYDCVIFHRLHGFLMPLVYEQYEQDDQYFFNKSTILCNENVTAEQLGAPENYAIPLLAAVVELASLNNHKSPLEKVHCLCATYDLIFAELKTALINIISRFSVTESEIPVINNDDIIPILMTVIIRSKLIHLCSNFYYIQTFIGRLDQNDSIRHVLNSFKEAIGRLKLVTKGSLGPSCEKVCRDLDLPKLMKVTSEMNTKMMSVQETITPLDEQLLRITDLIVTSTNENQPAL